MAVNQEQEKWINMLKTHPEKIGVLAGFDKFTELHGDWIKKMLFCKDIYVLKAHRASFKCLAPETKVMMSDYSSKAIKDINIGDYVMGWDGTPRKVVHKHSGASPMYRVTLDKSGEYYECNNNHILTMRQRPIKHNKFHCVDEYRFEKDRNIINIPVEDFLKSKANKRTHGETGDSFFKHFKVGLDNIPEKKLAIPPYVMGLWLGDGNKGTVGVTIADKDIVILKEFRDFCLSRGAKEHVYRKTNAVCATYYYACGDIRSVFNKYNVFGDKKIPDDFLYNSRQNRLELLAGLIDTDGCKGGTHYSFSTTREYLAKQVEWLARSLGFHATATKYKTNWTHNGIKKEKDAWQVYINGAIDKIPVRLERKKAEKKQDTKRHLSFSQTITPIGEGDFVGISVEGDGLFLLDNFLVVHNTCCLEVVIALFIILKPNCSIFFVRKTDDDVKEVVSKVYQLLNKDVFKLLAKVIHGVDLVIEKHTAYEIDTNLNQRKELISAQLLGFGLKGSITGKHCDILVMDDICNTRDRESYTERELTKRVYFELDMNVKKKGGVTIVTGTTWHVDDVFSVLPPAEIKTCYETGLLSTEQIDDLKAKMPPDLFAANYELRFVASGDCMFTTPKFTSDESLIYDGICHVDAGYGGNDWTAFTIMRKIKENKFVVFGKAWRRHVNDCIPEIETLIKKYRCGTLYLENNGDKGYLAQEFRHRKIKCATYHERMNKHTKISTYAYRVWHDVVFLDKTDEQYIGQILDYTEMADHDDCIDSFAVLCRKFLGTGKASAISGLRI